MHILNVEASINPKGIFFDVPFYSKQRVRKDYIESPSGEKERAGNALRSMLAVYLIYIY
jgi:hypothetical protein